MIDRLVVAGSIRKHSSQSALFEPAEVITRKELTNPNSQRLVVLFPPWHGADFLSSILKFRAQRRGTALLSLSFHDQLLSADVERVKQSFNHIGTEMAKNIEGLSGKYSEVHLLGFSLGNVALAITAMKLQSEFRATCVVGSSNLAKSTWRGIRTQEIRQSFEDSGITEEALDAKWAELAPGNNVAGFDNKRVNLVISVNDETIPTVFQEELALKIEQAGAELAVKRTSLGHVMSIVKFATTDNF